MATMKLFKAAEIRHMRWKYFILFSADMNIPCLRTLLIPRLRTLLKLVQGNRRFSNRIKGLLQNPTTGKLLGAMGTGAEPWKPGNEAAVCLSIPQAGAPGHSSL